MAYDPPHSFCGMSIYSINNLVRMHVVRMNEDIKACMNVKFEALIIIIEAKMDQENDLKYRYKKKRRKSKMNRMMMSWPLMYK